MLILKKSDYSVDLTLLIDQSATGQKEATDKLFDIVYKDLRKLAHKIRLDWRQEETLNTTALVHEAYIKVCKGNDVTKYNKLHFFRICGRAMRYILQDYVKLKNAQKRGGNLNKIDLDEIYDIGITDELADDLNDILSILKELEEKDAVICSVIECRFFSDMTVKETAEILSISPATVKRKWSFARAYLASNLKKSA